MTTSKLSPAVQRFIELEKQKAHVKQYFEELKQATEAVVAELGVGSYFQDSSDGTVFKMVEPAGRFVNYERFGYVRTRREGEKKGDLSMKEAQEAGFEVE